MSKYIFEPEDLQRIVNMHLDAPLDQRFNRIGETLKAMSWKPPSSFNMPPRNVNRDVSLPAAWAHLAKKD